MMAYEFLNFLTLIKVNLHVKRANNYDCVISISPNKIYKARALYFLLSVKKIGFFLMHLVYFTE